MRARTNERTIHGLLTWGVIAAGVAFVACGKTVGLGDEKTSAGGAGGTVGAQGSGAIGGSSSGAEGGSGGAPGGSTGMGGGSVGAGGEPGGDAGSCKVPRPPPAPNPTPAELERAELARAFCVNLADHGCIDSYEVISGGVPQATGCSVADKIAACTMDQLYLYLDLIDPECHDEWQAALSCAKQAEFAQACNLPVSLISRVIDHTSVRGVCHAEEVDLEACVLENPHNRSESVTGTRTTCEYGLAFGGTSCNVLCSMASDKPVGFNSMCSGPPGLPLQCSCMANLALILNYGSDEDGGFYAGDCKQAAQIMADGFCVNRADCCFTSTLGLEDGESECHCTSDPSFPQLGQPTCEALAAARGGEVVDLCPRYKGR
jgi:hypothetical protein